MRLDAAHFDQEHCDTKTFHLNKGSERLISAHTCFPYKNPTYIALWFSIRLIKCDDALAAGYSARGVPGWLTASVLKAGRPKGLVSSNLTPSARFSRQSPSARIMAPPNTVACGRLQ